MPRRLLRLCVDGGGTVNCATVACGGARLCCRCEPIAPKKVGGGCERFIGGGGAVSCSGGVGVGSGNSEATGVDQTAPNVAPWPLRTIEGGGGEGP